MKRVAELQQLLEERLAARTVSEWCALFREAGIPSGPIYDVPEMLQNEQIRARDFVVEQEHPAAGVLKTLACPVNTDRAGVCARRDQWPAQIQCRIDKPPAPFTRQRDARAAPQLLWLLPPKPLVMVYGSWVASLERRH